MTDISELFRRDPLKLTRTDISEIIGYYRKARASFNLTGAPKRKAKPKPKADPKATKLLNDLGL